MKVALLHFDCDTLSRLAAHLREAGLLVQPVSSVEDLVCLVTAREAGIVVADLCVPDMHEGMQLIAHVHAIDAGLPIVALSERDDAATAVEAMRKGARDVLTPDRLPRLVQACSQALRARELALRVRAAALDAGEDETPSRPGGASIKDVLRGNHPAIARLRQTLLRLARVDADVLVKAETGCGKEVVARCLHDFGPRASKPFVAINCGAIPENIFESELFGHEPGAFTGAGKRRIGKLEFAAGGTVFLDEIESLPMLMQVKLLRALQQRCVERVGGNEPVSLRCRVVAAAKDDLLALSRSGRFRLDLYYRLNVLEIALPPLRERREDIPLLACAFAREAAERHGLEAGELDIDFMCALMARDWPGNVRELRNAVERRLLGMPDPDSDDDALQMSLPEQVAVFERTVIEQCLRQCRGSVAHASEILKVPRKTLYDKLARFCVDPALFRSSELPMTVFSPPVAPAGALMQ